MKRGREKGGNVKEKEKWEVKAKRADRSKNNTMSREGKNFIFGRGGGVNVIFRPKYRPLFTCEYVHKDIKCKHSTNIISVWRVN